MVSLKEFPKIDAHIHFNANRDHLLQMAEDYGFSLVSINTEVPEFPPINAQQQLILSHRNKTDVDLNYATTVSTENVFADGWADQAIAKIENDLNNGAIGVKFWKNIGMSVQRPNGDFLKLDDEELEPVFAYLEDQNIPVLGHQGEPKNCWLPIDEMTVKSDREYFSGHPEYHMYKHNEYPDYWDHIKARDHILERHPSLNFVGLHLASLEWNIEEVMERLDQFPNLMVDLAERITHLYYQTADDRQQMIDFFTNYQDRIIYGTDIIDDPDSTPQEIRTDLENRWTTHWQFFTTDDEMYSPQVDSSFRGLDLPETILEKLYRTNAIKRYHLDQM